MNCDILLPYVVPAIVCAICLGLAIFRFRLETNGWIGLAIAVVVALLLGAVISTVFSGHIPGFWSGFLICLAAIWGICTAALWGRDRFCSQ